MREEIVDAAPSEVGLVNASPHLKELILDSGITEHVIANNAIETVRSAAVAARRAGRPAADFDDTLLPVLSFGYIRLGETEPYLYSLKPPRPMRVGRDGDKEAKYVRTSGCSAGPFMPTEVRQLEGLLTDTSLVVVITEGEKKALSGVSHGLVCIGLAGVDAIGPKPKRGEKKRLDEDLEKLAIRGREFFIAFDSDRINKPKVRAAETRVVRELIQRGCHVFSIQLPPAPDGRKVGLDDFLVAEGAQGFERLVLQARSRGALTGKENHATERPLFELQSLADVRPERLEWLWPGFMPEGKLVLVEGDPGIGKSVTLLDIAARITRGAAMPGSDLGSAPADVIIVQTEDAWSDTVVPRLIAAGAELPRIHRLCMPDGNEPALSLPDDVERLRALIEERGVRLLILDPLSQFLSVKTDHNSEPDVRRALTPLANLAGETGCTVAGVRHLTKNVETARRFRGMGSVGFGAVARSVLHYMRDAKSGQALVYPVKANNASSLTAYSYSINTNDSGMPTVQWDAARDVSEVTSGTENKNAAEACADALRASLKNGERVASVTLEAAVAELGYSHSTFNRARKIAGVRSRLEGESWVCWLPTPLTGTRT